MTLGKTRTIHMAKTKRVTAVMNQEEYDKKILCINCRTWVVVILAKGKDLFDYCKKTNCENCGCKMTKNRKIFNRSQIV